MAERPTREQFAAIVSRVKAHALRNIDLAGAHDRELIASIRTVDTKLADLVQAGIDHRREISESILRYINGRHQ